MERAPFALEMLNISKTFPGVRALDDVSFGCARGEIHALCGENGAGKSTLIKILGGAYRPDRGRILLDGHEVEFSHPVASRRAGVSIIHQELSLLPHRSVAENIFLGIEPTRYGMLDRRKMRADAGRLLGRLGSSIRAETGAGDLSIAQQQLVEIAKALAIDARILVMDEPTAALDRDDAARLLDLVKRLSEQGVSLIYVSHRMPEIKTIADRVTVLKDGRTVMTAPIAEAPTGRLVRAMVGRDLADFYPPRAAKPPGAPALVIREAANDHLINIDLTVRAGEIVGVAGLEGAGKSALGRAIAGDEPFERGAVEIAGKALTPRSPRSAIEAGIGRLSEDRKREGLLMQQSLRETRWSAANRIFKENGVNVVGAEFTGGDNAKTKQIVEDYINRNGKIDAVWMDAGATAVAALEAFEDSGQPYPIITGEDQEDFLKKWKEKGLTAMAPTYPTYQWRAPVIAAVKVLKGEPVIGPTWKLPQPVITQAELDKYVDDKMPPLHYAMCGCKDLPGYPQRWGGK